MRLSLLSSDSPLAGRRIRAAALLAPLAVLACSDGTSTSATSPAARPSASRSAAPDGGRLGEPPLAGPHVVMGAAIQVPGGAVAVASAYCPAGEAVTGGGHLVQLGNMAPPPFDVLANRPTSEAGAATGWTVMLRSGGNSGFLVQVFAICLAQQ